MSGSPESLSFGPVEHQVHSLATESIVVPATKLAYIDRPEFVDHVDHVDHVKLVVALLPCRATSSRRRGLQASKLRSLEAARL
jgi:hypothetical protein